MPAHPRFLSAPRSMAVAVVMPVGCVVFAHQRNDKAAVFPRLAGDEVAAGEAHHIALFQLVFLAVVQHKVRVAFGHGQQHAVAGVVVPLHFAARVQVFAHDDIVGRVENLALARGGFGGGRGVEGGGKGKRQKGCKRFDVFHGFSFRLRHLKENGYYHA